MAYELTSGQVAAVLRERGVVLSTSTVQRYARQGVIPCRPTPGGRYRFDIAEVLAALDARSPSRGLSAEPLTGGLGRAELPADSPSQRLRRQMRGHVSSLAPVTAEGADAAPSAVREQLAHSSRRSLALA